jgi:hypothetical protein
VLALRWSDVDWKADRLRIESSKTGLRFCPMFPEIRKAIDQAQYVAPDGAVWCITRYWGGLANLRTQFGRILERAGVVPWPKPFVNLRSTRRTELQEMFPDHVVNSWLGHSGAVAAKHYLQVTDEHWSRAAEPVPPLSPSKGQIYGKNVNSRSPIGSPIAADPGPSSESADIKKPRENPGFDGSRWLPDSNEMTPTGIEPVLPP